MGQEAEGAGKCGKGLYWVSAGGADETARVLGQASLKGVSGLSGLPLVVWYLPWVVGQGR